MKRARRWRWIQGPWWGKVLRRVALGVGAMALLLFVVLHFVVPWVVHRQIVRSLAGLGVGPAAVRVSSVGWSGAELRDLEVGAAAPLRVAAVSAQYDLASLRQGAVTRLQITGLEIPVQYQDGKLRLGSWFDALMQPRASAAPGPVQLPFDRLDVRDSRVVVQLGGQQIVLPLRATIRRLANQITADLELRHQRAVLLATATLDPATLDYTLNFDSPPLDVEALLALLPPDLLKLPVHAGGQISLHARHGRQGAAATSAVDLQLSGAWVSGMLVGRPLQAKDVTLSAAVALDGDYQPQTTALRLRSGAIHVAGRVIDSVSLDLKGRGRASDFDLRAAGESWRLQYLRGQVTLPTAEDASLGQPVQVRGDFEIAGTPPVDLLDRLEAAGVQLGAAPPATLRGHATAAVGPMSTSASRQLADWHCDAQITEARLSVPATDVTLPAAGLVLRGVALDLPFTASKAGRGVRVSSLGPGTPATGVAASTTHQSAGPGTPGAWAGARVVVQAVESSDPRLRIVKLDPAAPLLELATGEQPLACTVSFEPGAASWELAPARLQVRLAPLDLVDAPDHVAFRGAGGTLNLDISPALAPLVTSAPAAGPSGAGGAGLAVALTEDSRLSLGRLDATIAGSRFQSGPIIIAPARGSSADVKCAGDATSPATVPILTVDLAHAGYHADLPLRIEAADFAASLPQGIEVKVRHAELTTLVTLARAAAPRAASDLALTGASVSAPAWQMALGDISARVPIAWRAGSAAEFAAPTTQPGAAPSDDAASTTQPEPGRFTIGSIALGADHLPALTGQIAARGAELLFAADWPLLPGGTVHADGQLDLAAPRPTGSLRAALPPIVIADPQLLAGLSHYLKGITFTGGLSASADLKLDAGRLDPQVDLEVTNANIESVQYEAKVEGLSAAVTLDRLGPLSTPGDQQVRMRSGKLGKLAVSDGFLAFRVERPHALMIERVEANWAGGRLYSHAFRVDPAKPDVAVTVFFDGIDLHQVLAAVAPGKADGEGKLYGRLEVALRQLAGGAGGKQQHLDFGNGFLYAAPGVGVLSIQDPQIVSQVLDQAIQTAPPEQKAQLTLAKDRVIAALRDLAFTVLKVDLLHDGRGAVARFLIAGKGRRGPIQQEIGGLTVDAIGFDQAINQYLFLRK